MIAIDRKVCKDILKLTKDYNTSVIFAPDINGYAIWHKYHPEKADQPSSVPAHEVKDSLVRLSDRKMILKIQGSMSGAVVFRITPELLHAKAFWWDRFSKTYVAGFISGVASSVAGGLILQLLIRLIWPV